jgi:hypothetical protein
MLRKPRVYFSALLSSHPQFTPPLGPIICIVGCCSSIHHFIITVLKTTEIMLASKHW